MSVRKITERRSPIPALRALPEEEDRLNIPSTIQCDCLIRRALRIALIGLAVVVGP